MRRCSGIVCLATAAIQLFCVLTCRAQDSLHAGPIYTFGTADQGSPVFPSTNVLIGVPPGTRPETVAPLNFRLQVDGGPETNASQVTTLANSGYGVAVSVALDVSGSMRGRPLDAVRQGLGQFVSDAGPQDKFAIETIADDARWDSDWTDTRDHAKAAIAKLSVRGHLTRLWDALLEALERLPPEPKAKRVLVISDGHDEGSSHHLEEVITAARSAGVTVDAIGITRSQVKYLDSLRQLSSSTGGNFRQANTTPELRDLVGKGIQSVKSLPVASFVVQGITADGKHHTFKVIWNHDGTTETGSLQAAVPPPETTKKAGRNTNWTVPILSLAGVLLSLIAGGLLLFRRKNQSQSPLPVQSPAPVPAPAPLTIAQPPPPPAAPIYAGAVPVRASMVPDSARARQPQFAVPAALPAAAPVAVPARPETQIAARFPPPAKDHPAAWLVGESGAEAGKRYAIDSTEFWIGALENNQMRIASDPTVSGNHACIVFDHDVLGIWDHRSTNGTRVNGELIGEMRRLLRPGDRIRIGSSTFVLRPNEG